MSQDSVFPIQAHWQSVNLEIEALNHFKQSPFYSKDCNNESPAIPLNDLGLSVLSQMVGYEYVIDTEASSKPILWVIRYQFRVSPVETCLTNAYYLLFGNIYQAPQALNLIESRLSKGTFHVEEAFREFSIFKPNYNPLNDCDNAIDDDRVEEDNNVLVGEGSGLSQALNEELHHEYLSYKKSLT
mmetsp:Transcript_30294/g.35752  ORF Transcript_30294/g.35752 Transcript_30294/m.35752 type:complete len:185 (+) Transcript_30294:70-624(+)